MNAQEKHSGDRGDRLFSALFKWGNPACWLPNLNTFRWKLIMYMCGIHWGALSAYLLELRSECWQLPLLVWAPFWIKAIILLFIKEELSAAPRELHCSRLRPQLWPGCCPHHALTSQFNTALICCSSCSACSQFQTWFSQWLLWPVSSGISELG